MSNLSEAVKRALFTGSQTGRGVRAFFIASTVVGSTIFVLSMTRVFDTDSTYIIPFFATLLHHYIIFLFLSDEAKASGINLNPPTQARFAALRHQSNFPILVLLAMSWLACAAYYLMVYSLENSWDPKYAGSELAGVALAVIEGGLLMKIAVRCRRLQQEAEPGWYAACPLDPEQPLEDE